MFFSVASPDWKPGQTLTPAGALLFRSRAEAESFAPDARVVGIAVRYDSARQTVAALAQDFNPAGRWSASAVGNSLGGVTVFGSIPSDLIRDPADLDRPWLPAPVTHPVPSLVAGFHGWDSLTMALLA